MMQVYNKFNRNTVAKVTGIASFAKIAGIAKSLNKASESDNNNKAWNMLNDMLKYAQLSRPWDCNFRAVNFYTSSTPT